MKRSVFATTFLFSVCIAFAQSGDPVRIEIPTRSGTDPINYVKAGREGVLIFYPTISEAGKDSISWSFMMTDEKLKESWRKEVPLHEDVTYLKGISNHGAIYLLFHDTKRNKDGNIFVYMVIPKYRLITEHRSGIPEKAEVVDFDMLGDLAIVGYNTRKEQPGIVAFSLVTAEKRNIEITSEKNALLLDLAPDTTSKLFYATYKIQSSSTKNHLYVNAYSVNGSILQSVDFGDQQEKRNINTAQFLPTGKGNGLLAGSYGYYTTTRRTYDYYDSYYNYYYNSYYPYYYRQQDYNANDDNTPVSDGFFTVAINNGVTGSMKYYSFSDFSHSFKYMTNLGALRSKFKAERHGGKEAENDIQPLDAGEKVNTLNLKVLTHELVEQNRQYMLVAEAYSPEFHTVTRMNYDFYGRAFPTSYQVFDGFRYSNAFVASFDSAGKMLWNNGMEMRDILTKNLNRKLNHINDQDETVLFYNANNKIGFKTIRQQEIVDNTAYAPIVQKRGTDQPIDEYLGTIEHWYDGYFIASGYQTIRNNYLETNRRTVFYINKLAYR